MSDNSNYQLVCGIEIHAELKTKSKMFCGCKNDPFFAPGPNTYTCPVCLGMPGALPVPNRTAIEWTIKLGLALNCKTNLFSKFDRKHYFYPDLPKGYQISQYDLPFCYDGMVETSEGPVRIHRIHLEEDTGKLIHKTVDGEKVSLIDFNRSSVPLVEIVTEADIKTPTQAKEYAKKLRQILRFLDIADCDMEQGGMRLEANISLRPEGQTELPNYKVEVKNINSFRFLEQAIGFEMQRQAIELMDGKTPRQETRGWDSVNNTTFPQRSKEDAEDYRYFPEPDIPPIHLTQKMIDDWRAELPEMPEVLVERWQTEYGIEPRTSLQLLQVQSATKFWEDLWKVAITHKIESNKIAASITNGKLKMSEQDTAENIVKKFDEMNKIDDVSDEEIEKITQSVISDNPNEVAAYRNGKEALLNFFMGQVLKKLQRKVDSARLRAILQKRLK